VTKAEFIQAEAALLLSSGHERSDLPMKYLSFSVNNYRGISSAVAISLKKQSLYPIIGINESGKTTILHAIFAFDYFNDKLNDNGRHLRDVGSLYEVPPKPPQVTAVVACTSSDFIEALISCGITQSTAKRHVNKQAKESEIELKITRTLSTMKPMGMRYSADGFKLPKGTNENDFARALIRRLPYILFFDDFRDSIEDRVRIDAEQQSSPTGWLAIIEQLFKKTDEGFSVFQLHLLEERQQRSVLAKVSRHLNETLTREWQNFRLDDRNALQILVQYRSDDETEGSLGWIELDIAETDAKGDEHYFYLRDRSKGFYWFFNFVMKLEFNPKVIEGTNIGAVYLLDEPGSYLHSTAQRKLCRKLKSLSDQNAVVYCTHSHYLLDPLVIPLSSIRIADKDDMGSVHLTSLYEHSAALSDRKSALQPVIDALEITPFISDMTASRMVVTEGIVDFYAYSIFYPNQDVGFLPAQGAGAIATLISLMIGWQIEFQALWDFDKDGKEAHTDAFSNFGEEIGTSRFHMLPPGRTKSGRSGSKRILQDLFARDDIRRIKEELELPRNTSFDKTISTWFYSDRRDQLRARISRETRNNFDEVFSLFDWG
jgi:ABC-type molybdenum transport system ATPase subunit/photorepair protein PhrA